MDRVSVYRDQLPYEEDVLLIGRYAYEGLGALVRDLIGSTTQVAGLLAAPTSPASLAVQVGAGSIYAFKPLDDAPQGQILGTGGIPADTDPDHSIMKQGLLRDPVTFAVTAPVTSGQSINYLIQARFVEEDAAASDAQFYNTANPNAPITDQVSRARYNRCEVGIKAGTAATTGAQTTPSADAGWVPVWVVTVANGATTVTGGNITEHPSAPFISVSGGGGGGGGSGLSAWATITGAYTAVAGDRLIANSAGGAFTITLPASPSDGDEVTVRHPNAGTNNVTMGRNGKNTPDVNGAPTAANVVLNQNNRETRFVYSTGLNMWTVSQ
jgi:hypothetical protein